MSNFRPVGPVVAASLLLCSSLPGCVTHPASYAAPVPEGLRATSRVVEVVSSVADFDDAQPRLEAPVGQGKQAAQQGAAGAGAGLVTGVLFTVATGPMGLALAPIMIPTLTIGGLAGGAAAGWMKAVPTEDARAVEAAFARSRADLSAEVARRIADRLPSVGRAATSAVAGEPPDLRIEVSIDRWGLAGGAGSDPLTGFFMALSYRVTDVQTATKVAEGRFIDGGPQRIVSAWTADDAAPLTRAIDAALGRVAEAVVDAAFLVYDFHVERPGITRAACGLNPVSPRAIRHFGVYETGPERVGSVSPRLVWESFPRRNDLEDDAANLLAQVSDVRYDLRLWSSERGGPGEVVYERTALALTPENGAVAHRVETSLAAGSSYLWSVRARFRLRGEERVTRWSHDMFIDRDSIPLSYFDTHLLYTGPLNPYQPDAPQLSRCREVSIPPLHYFSFTTP